MYKLLTHIRMNPLATDLENALEFQPVEVRLKLKQLLILVEPEK